MTRTAPDPVLDPPLDPARLAAMVLELASQLHAERARRIALEAALTDAGALAPGAVAAAAERGETRRRVDSALARSVAKIMRVLKESPDPRAPLRAETTPRRPSLQHEET